MNIDMRFYWRLLLHRFPVMALLFMLCTGLAAFTAVRQPETFVTSARLLVEEPQIPESMVASSVRTDAAEQLSIIQQRLMTRANLIDIANRYNVYEDLGEVEPDTIVSRMQSDTTIRTIAQRNSATIMTISFQGRSGRVVSDVVNEYVTIVQEVNMDFRMGRAENTLDFFQQEVERLGVELDAQSVRIATFKSENSNALPENQSYRLGRQSLLQERLSQLQRDLRLTEVQRTEVQALYESTGQIDPAAGASPQRSPEEQQLLVARTDLQQALLTYTAENPRVVRLQNMVDRLEAIVATQTNANFVATEEGEEPLTPAEALLQASLSEVDNRIAAISAEIEGTQQELTELERAIAESSVNGIQLDALERDYSVIQLQYNAAVSNLNTAQMTERIETTAQGQRISVIENANIPQVPSGPNRARIVTMGAGLGLGLAGGFFALLEFLNRTIRRPVELVSRFNVTPFATIPYMESRTRRTVRRTALVLGSIIAIVGVPLALWYIDTNYMPLDLLVRQILSRLGIM